MCGRFALYSSFQSIKDYTDLLNEIDNIKPNYNVSPGQEIPIISYNNNRNILRMSKWGLIPYWAKEENINYKLINTRSETIAEKPTFKRAFLHRRCLIPANGFYEWRNSDKQPFYITLKDRELFSFAGIWELWNSPQGKQLLSCSIITSKSNQQMEDIHHRMPVILDKSHGSAWLVENDIELLHGLLKPHADEYLDINPVSQAVNYSKNNYPELIRAI
ncbi:MAG: SOS response-associated peptidase [Candidatus Cloacimonetes bacterium]|nr:SOS response-associated peptidase [Candidatus Cloacimonadota bacterium]